MEDTAAKSNHVNDAEPTLICELRISEEKYTKNGKRETEIIRNLGGTKRSSDFYAVEVHYLFDEKHMLEKTRLTVNSHHILKAFHDVIGSHPTVSADFSEPFAMESPFKMLFHHWDDLIEHRDSVSDDNARMHLNVLIEFMDIDLGQQRKELQAAAAAGLVSFSTLWTIFRPRDLAIEYLDGRPWLLEVKKTAYEENKNMGKFIEVHCIYTDFDGESVGRASRVSRIYQKQSFAQEDPANIVDLPIFPRAFCKEGTSLDDDLVERGHRFLQFREACIQDYEGNADYLRGVPPDFYDPDMDQFGLVWLHYAECGRVIIDRKTFQEDYPMKSLSKLSRVQQSDYKLCPPFVYGYSLTRKDWCRFYLHELQAPTWETNSFDSLILPLAKLDLVRASVCSHKPPSHSRDQMKQKGKGLVILLHGPPGSGKTLTAECAAEATQRGLISTTLPELNKYDHPAYFERQLKEILRLATTWNAIVLFDEADVFLQSEGDDSAGGRSATRNTLVAVFLRNLEYFSGIAFLTTNRIKAFDVAMKSRVHLALGYPAPDANSRARIWTNALRKIGDNVCSFDIDDAVLEWAREELNGRQITNATSTAFTLARYSKTKLSKSHIDTIIQMWKGFDLEIEENSPEVVSAVKVLDKK